MLLLSLIDPRALFFFPAIMSFNFHQVKSHEQSELFKLRARIILDIEAFMSEAERSDRELFPDYFQILMKKTGAAVAAAESEKTFDSVVLHSTRFILARDFIVEQDMSARLDAQAAAIEKLCVQTTGALAAADARIAEMSRTLSVLLEHSASVNRKV